MSTTQYLLNAGLLAFVLWANLGTRTVSRVRFTLPLLLVAVAATGHGARGWLIAIAALALAVWLGSLAVSAFRR